MAVRDIMSAEKMHFELGGLRQVWAVQQPYEGFADLHDMDLHLSGATPAVGSPGAYHQPAAVGHIPRGSLAFKLN